MAEHTYLRSQEERPETEAVAEVALKDPPPGSWPVSLPALQRDPLLRSRDTRCDFGSLSLWFLALW
jgi:hypothetical protein